MRSETFIGGQVSIPGRLFSTSGGYGNPPYSQNLAYPSQGLKHRRPAGRLSELYDENIPNNNLSLTRKNFLCILKPQADDLAG